MAESERFLRPDPRRLVRLTTIVVVALWLLLGAFTGYAALWWPDHHILDNSPAEWITGSMMLSLIFAAPFAISWLGDRRVTWRVNSEGVEVRRGDHEWQSFTWMEVKALDVLPFAVVVRLTRAPLVVRLPWPAVSDATWLREFVEDRIEIEHQRTGSEHPPAN